MIEELAELLKDHRIQMNTLIDKSYVTYEERERIYQQLVDGVADICGELNPNFTYSTFRAACGL